MTVDPAVLARVEANIGKAESTSVDGLSVRHSATANIAAHKYLSQCASTANKSRRPFRLQALIGAGPTGTGS